MPSVPRARLPSVFCWVGSTCAADVLETLPVENREGSIFLSSSCCMKELSNTDADSEYSCPPPHPGYDTGGGLESLIPHWAWSPAKSIPFPRRLRGMSQLAMLVDFSRTFACSQKWHHLLEKCPSVISLIAFSPFSELYSMLDHFLSTKWIYFPLSSQIPKAGSERSKFGLKPIPYFLC